MGKKQNGQLELKDLKGNHSEIDIKADLVLLAMGFLHPKKDKLIEKLGLDLDERGNVKANDFDYKTNQKNICFRRYEKRTISCCLGN